MRIRNSRTYIIGERSEPLSRVFNDQPRDRYNIYTRKMVPIPKRASSFLVVVFIHVNRKEEEEDRTTTVYQRL